MAQHHQCSEEEERCFPFRAFQDWWGGTPPNRVRGGSLQGPGEKGDPWEGQQTDLRELGPGKSLPEQNAVDGYSSGEGGHDGHQNVERGGGETAGVDAPWVPPRTDQTSRRTRKPRQGGTPKKEERSSQGTEGVTWWHEGKFNI